MKRYALFLMFNAAILMGCHNEASVKKADAPPINLTAEIERAKADGKWVLLDFTGSDWCEPCRLLHAEVLSKPEFQEYAKSRLIFLEVDFPRKVQLPPGTQATNDLLMTQFEVEGFPTLIALDGAGRVAWRNVGYLSGGPKELIARLEAAWQKTQ